MKNIATATDAVAIFDPFLASDRGVLIVRSILDQARREPRLGTPDITPTNVEHDRFVVRHRVGPLVARAFPSPASTKQVRALMLSQLQLAEVSKEVCSALAAAGIQNRVLKGLATSELDYDLPSRRHTGDVDLLVRRTDLEAAVDILIRGGLKAADGGAADAGTLIDGHNMKGVVLEHASGVEVDIHHRLSRFALPPETDALMANPTALIAERFALAPEGRLVHAAAHAVLSPNPGRRLSSVADIVAIIDNTTVDWAWARQLADALALTEAAGVALRAEALIMSRGAHPGLAWPRPGRLLHSLTSTTGRVPVLEHVAAMQALPPGMTSRQYLALRLRPAAALRNERSGRWAYYRGLIESAGRR